MEKNLRLKFHGRILDQLGFQTYQSPVASLSELVANAWDADADKACIELPSKLGSSASIIIGDTGNGMTFAECQDKYLNIGYDRRGGDPLAKTPKGRCMMGRKGIGKFAGFGIAKKILVETTSIETGQKTVFEMDIESLRSNKYVEEGGDISATSTEPDENMKKSHGTTVTLKGLSLSKNIPESKFAKSLSRRFLVHQTAGDFHVTVNGKPIPTEEDVSGVEFTFPRDYREDKIPEGVKIADGGWGIETLPNGKEIRWKFNFNKETISDQDLQGVTIFANGKLVQKPFFFNLSGGMGGQAGQSYMFGQVVADFVDQMDTDPISTERQRVNWELADTEPLLEWGQGRVKKLLVEWHDARGEKRRKKLEERVSGFGDRLGRLGTHERQTVKKVLTKLGGIATISEEKFGDMADSIMTSWEGGRLKDLWEDIAATDDLSESRLLDTLIETEVISALNVAEAIKTKLQAISELKSRISKQDLENAVRDHLAENPWIISPKWDTFKKETRVAGVVQDQARESGLEDTKYKGRADLVLSSGEQLLILEFMRPGQTLDWDHVQRCERYVQHIRSSLKSHTAFPFKSISGYVIADKIDTGRALQDQIQKLKEQDIVVNDWSGLLSGAKAAWDDYLHILVKRGKGDSRLENLLED